MNTKNTNPGLPENYLSALKSRDYGSSYKQTENWIFRSHSKLKEERKMSAMKSFITANKMKFVYTFIVLLVIAAACSMPVTQQVTEGNIVTWTMEKSENNSAELNKLDWLKNANMTVNENVNNGKAELLYTATLSNTSESDIQNYTKQLEKIKGVNSLKVFPISHDVKKPLYSAALYKFFRVNINATGMSDEELQKELSRQLKEQGSGMQIEFKTGADGKRDIFVKAPENKDGSKDPKMMEVNIDNSGNKQVLKFVEKKADPNKFKGKTDEEIRKIVREDLGNPNIKDEEIKITREGDKVKIEVNREEKR